MERKESPAVPRCRLLAAGLIAAGLAVPAVAQATFGDRPLREGSRGHDVRVLQDFLTRVGLTTTVDGQFGPKTARRVRSWERRSDVRVNGRVSRGDARKLRSQVEQGVRVYDCSGAMSYALHGGGLLNRQLTSGDFMSWGKAGKGSWITVYAHGGHGFLVIAGLRFDTGYNNAGNGPRWSEQMRPTGGYPARHPPGLRLLVRTLSPGGGGRAHH